jgi:hypothetical protein
MTTTGSTWSPSTTVEPLVESLHVYTRMPRIYVQGYVQRRASAFDCSITRLVACVLATWLSCLGQLPLVRPQPAAMLAEKKRRQMSFGSELRPFTARMLLDRKLQARRSFQSSCQQILHSSPVAIAWSISMGHEVLARDDRQACPQRYRRMTTPRRLCPALGDHSSCPARAVQ